MAVNCSTRIKKIGKSTFPLPGSPSSYFSLEFVSSPSFFPHIISSRVLQSFLSPPPHPTPPRLSMPSSLGCFILCCKLGLPPHHGFCFLSQVHVAHIQIAPGWARPPVCWVGQPAVQAGLRRQDKQSAAGSGGAHQAAVKRGQQELTGWSWVILRLAARLGGPRIQPPLFCLCNVLSLELDSESFTCINISKSCQHALQPKN